MSKKRSAGEGAIRRLKSGLWFAQIMDGYKDNGKRNLISISAPTRSEVLDKIRQYWNAKDELGGRERRPWQQRSTCFL